MKLNDIMGDPKLMAKGSEERAMHECVERTLLPKEDYDTATGELTKAGINSVRACLVQFRDEASEKLLKLHHRTVIDGMRGQ